MLFAENLCQGQEPWHTSPDKWNEPRIYHFPPDSDLDKQIVKERLLIQRDSTAIPTGEKFLSPNKAYFYTIEKPDMQKPGPWDTVVYVYNEREGLQRIDIKDHSNYGVKIEWINEKLLFLRIWWGRVLGTDLILDIETESVIYEEMFRYGGIEFQQFEQGKPKK